MARKYAVAGNCINTASSTLPLANLVGATTIRPLIYDIMLGSDATPADNDAKYAIQRGTTAGTWAGAGGAAITPQALDPADPAALATANQGVASVGPTLTAAAFLLQWAQNMRATFRWVAAPGSELKIPATANNSLNLMSLVVGGSAVNQAFSFLYEE
jgi:hypothetical protein